MKQIFVDTSAWDAIADAGDANHEIALLYKDEIAENCRLVVTNYILDELHTLMLMNQGYHDTVDFKRQLDVMRPCNRDYFLVPFHHYDKFTHSQTRQESRSKKLPS